MAYSGHSQNDEYEPETDDYIPSLTASVLSSLTLKINELTLQKSIAVDVLPSGVKSEAGPAVAVKKSTQVKQVVAKKQTLRIIAKTSMNNGKCYIGFDRNDQTIQLWRPIMTTQEGLCCWQSDLQLGAEYKFTIIKKHPDEIPYPHRWNDVLVSEVVTHLGTPQRSLFDDLVPLGKASVAAVFHPRKLQYSKYVNEGVICPSAGIYKCKGRQLKTYNIKYQSGQEKIRMKIDEGMMQYDFPITALSYQDSFQDDEDVLVVLGLGRPFDGNGNLNPKRCYVLVIGII